MALEEFVTKHLELLSWEREAEIQESREILEKSSSKELQEKGVCLIKLNLTTQSTGLYGRMLLTFEATKHHGEQKLPSHRITTGDIVGVSPSQKHDGIQAILTSGIVWKVTSSKVVVAVDEEGKRLDSEGGLFMLIKLTNDVTYKRLKKALSSLNQNSSGPAAHLIDVLFSAAQPGSPLTVDYSNFDLFNPNLDESQVSAVKFALQQPDVAVIHGPPGTGKTTTVVEIILQLAKQQKKILACAPSNVAVDNMVEKLSHYKSVKLLRLGHPARLLRDIQRYSLDAVLAASDAGKLVQDVRRDVDKVLERMSRSKAKDERKSLRNELKYLRKELRNREEQALKFILSSADVVLATTTGASLDGPLKHLSEDHFDLVVIDECAQSLEVGCWIPLLFGSRCILAGDHQQLPPTILSEKAAEQGLGVSLMERVISIHGDAIVRMLTTQYRMHSDIMTWSSLELYEGKLVAHESVSTHLLRDLPGVDDTDVTSLPLLLIDTVGCDILELELEQEASKGNEGEADLVTIHVEALVSGGVKPSDIAVIAPYNLQVELIRLRLGTKYPTLEVNSVDGFQGREKEAVVISLVRSNARGKVGFLKEDRRINVAVTRARRHLAVICNSETVSHHPFLKTLMDYLNSHGEVHSVFQYMQELEELESHSYRPEHLVFKESQKTYQFKATSSQQTKGSKMAGRGTSTTKPQGAEKNNDEKREKMDQKDEEKVKKILEEFQKGTETEMQMSSELTSRERFIVHKVAENEGLYHLSKGDGDDRFVVISKHPIQPDKEVTEYSVVENNSSLRMIASGDQNIHIDDAHVQEPKTDESVEMDKTANPFSLLENDPTSDSAERVNILEEGDDSTEKEGTQYSATDVKSCNMKKFTKDGEIKMCQYCEKGIPMENFVLHEIHCEKTYEQRKLIENKKRQKAKIDKSKQKNLLENTKAEDFDKLIKIAKKQDGICNYLQCKEKVFILGILCNFCNRRYCMLHQMPEVHGCGEMAKVDAIKQRNKAANQVKQRSSGSARAPSVDANKKAALQRKMEKKRGEMESQRQRKINKKK